MKIVQLVRIGLFYLIELFGRIEVPTIIVNGTML